ncbi:MAG: hypothetical protein KatS3mg087_1072 [Patescibacteria group bacterium]|nr:MAG: hypothetical protein KatS3mg087_1072 [Patescibacteria group bacterium]
MTQQISASVVRGVKIFDIWKPNTLYSPRAAIPWPSKCSAYSSSRGFFFWALPPSWYDRIVPLRPGSAAVIVRVLPRETQAQPIEPSPDTGLQWPDYAPTLPQDCDCIVARNLVAIAATLTIERVIVPGTSYWPGLEKYAPVSICDRTPYPRVCVDDDSWLIETDNYFTVICGSYDSVAVPHHPLRADIISAQYSYVHAPRTCRGLIDRVTRILRSSVSTA